MGFHSKPAVPVLTSTERIVPFGANDNNTSWVTFGSASIPDTEKKITAVAFVDQGSNSLKECQILYNSVQKAFKSNTDDVKLGWHGDGLGTTADLEIQAKIASSGFVQTTHGAAHSIR